MRKQIVIYKECIKIAISQAFAYRADFMLSSVISLIGNILLPLGTLLIYNSGASFPNWGMYEVLLIQAVLTVSNGLAGIFFGSVIWVTMSHIREGSFDVVLLKPMNPLLFIITSNFTPESLGVIIGGIFLMYVALSNLGGASPVAWLQFLFLFLAGFSVMTGISMIMSAVTFKWVGNSRIPEIFDSIKSFGRYPIGIFPKAIQGLSAFIIPVGMIGFFPASALLGRSSPYMFVAVLPCLLFMLFGIRMYNRMISLYESVGG